MPAKFERCVKAVKKRGGAANAYAVCTAAGTRRTKRNSSSDDREYRAAAEASEEFHGMPAHEDIEVTEEVFEHENLAVCGELIKLEIQSINGGTVFLTKFDGAQLSRSPKGYPPQLFIRGGDQSVDLAEFGITRPHESEVLGKLKRVWYYTIKKHLGKDGGEANYRHRFGDNPEVFALKGNLPHVIYDVMSELLSISGGGYTILPEGIDN